MRDDDSGATPRLRRQKTAQLMSGNKKNPIIIYLFKFTGAKDRN